MRVLEIIRRCNKIGTSLSLAGEESTKLEGMSLSRGVGIDNRCISGSAVFVREARRSGGIIFG